MTDKEKMEYLFEIYNRQHYFIDRHDSMAEKFINILLVEVTCLSVVYTLIFGALEKEQLSLLQAISVFIFILSFVISLIKLLFIVQPLSKKAKKFDNESLVNNENKLWIKKSLLYYQGIINQIEDALTNSIVPSQKYLNLLEIDNITNDLIQQIFILAQYSNYKRKKLEIAIYWIIATTIIGLASITLLLFL